KLTSHATIATAGLYIQISQGIAGQPALGATALAIADVRVRRRNTGELIVDGSIKANHVEMETGYFDKMFGNTAMIGRINVGHREPSNVDTLNLSANEAITLQAERDDSVETDLADVETLADDAATIAAIADGKALAAEARATAAQTPANRTASRF